jgi:hypothetical protein
MISGHMADVSLPPVEETLAWEAEQRPRAALAALVAGNLTLVGGIASAVAFQDFPKVALLDGIRDAAGLKTAAGRGLRTDQLFFYDDKTFSLSIIALVLALGSAAMAAVLGYLFRATQARSQKLPRLALVGALAGPLLVAISGIVLQVAISLKAHSFVSGGDFSTATAHDALQGGAVLAAQVLRQIGVLLLAFSFVLISLNAMRVGLLTRFMGILGMIVGALFVIPLGSNLPIVQCFWLIAISFLIANRWPNGRPPAWETGRAQPWPSQQEIRERREGLAPAGAGSVAVTDDPPAPHPVPRKRKTRKRR